MSEHRDRLAGVHPDLAAKIGRILDAMMAAGFPMFVVSAVRTAEQQQALYAKGRTVPGDIVTNLDGVAKKSNHQPKADGFGHAVDCAFQPSLELGVADPFALSWPWSAYGALGEALGLTWGGRWVQPHDLPHLELR